MSQTKEEAILHENLKNIHLKTIGETWESVIKAMNQNAQFEAIAFAKWKDERFDKKGEWYYSKIPNRADPGKVGKTLEGLYQLFKQQ